MLENVVVYPGNCDPLGFSILGKLPNFALYSHDATKVTLGLRLQGKVKEIPLERTGDVWHAGVAGVTEEMEYAYRLEGPSGGGHRFNPDIWLSDPLSRLPATKVKWGEGVGSVWSFCKALPPFDWQNTPLPDTPQAELVIYEMHVRGFTKHGSSKTKHPGTYLGLIEKIPHLLKLGVNAVELMPTFEFDESWCNPKAEGKVNYWGYDPLFYFAPMRRYAENDPVTEFKTLVRELHRNGIKVILDVVYNHTGEAGEARSFNFRGIDNSVYYMVGPDGKYLDYTGCKNTVNANHPAVQEFILASLRYWASEVQVDGFRFDLASILTRGPDGQPMQTPPLLQKIASDPLLSKRLLIAESWDAAGLYQVGRFSDFGPFSEWNGKFRDHARIFLKGTDGFAGKFADVICGSQFLYGKHSPLSSVNFITAHDGFTLRDLVSYNDKHNGENGQNNTDGSNQNDSWNCGVEGETDESQVLDLRERQMRNFLLTLFLSQGIPMLLMGDEYGHTRKGNNNPYVQDNELNWFLWDELEKRQELFDFVSGLIAFRKAHPALRHSRFLESRDIDWHGSEPLKPDWSNASRLVACTLKGTPAIFFAFNADSRPKQLTLPKGSWKEAARTDRPWKEHHFNGAGPLLPATVELIPYSAILAVDSLKNSSVNGGDSPLRYRAASSLPQII